MKKAHHHRGKRYNHVCIFIFFWSIVLPSSDGQNMQSAKNSSVDSCHDSQANSIKPTAKIHLCYNVQFNMIAPMLSNELLGCT